MIKTITAHIKDMINLFLRGRYVLFANMTEKISFFLLFLIIARTYSQEVYGSVVALFALFNIIMSFFDFGFNTTIQRESAISPKNLSVYVGNCLSVRLTAFFPYFVMGYLYFQLTGGINERLNYLIATGVFIYGLNNLLNSILFGKKLFQESFWLLFVSRIVLITGIIISVNVSDSIESTIFIFLVSGILHLTLLLLYLWKAKIILPNLSFKIETQKVIFRSAIPLGIGVVMGLIYDRADVLIMQKYLGDTAVAVYAVAYSLYKFPQSFANGIFTPLFSNLSKINSEQGHLRFTDVKKTIIFLICYAALVALIAISLGEFIISLLYGSKYDESWNYFPYFMIALPFLLLNNLTSLTLNACYKEAYTTISIFLAALINVVMNILLLPRLGIIGAVLSAVLTEIFLLVIQVGLISKFRLIKV